MATAKPGSVSRDPSILWAATMAQVWKYMSIVSGLVDHQLGHGPSDVDHEAAFVAQQAADALVFFAV